METKKILEINTEDNTGLSLHPCTLQYIQYILAPIAKHLNTLNYEGILEWLSTVPTEIRSFLFAAVSRTREGMFGKTNIDYEDPKLIVDVRKNVMEYICSEIFDNIKGCCSDTDILPWDVLFTLRITDWSQELFQLPAPVKKNVISMGNNYELRVSTDLDLILPIYVQYTQCEYMVTLEYALGLLLFSAISGVDLGIRMFGISIDPVCITPRLSQSLDHSIRELVIEEQRYGFNSSQFTIGFSIGAMWAGVNPLWLKPKVYEHDYANDTVSEIINF